MQNWALLAYCIHFFTYNHLNSLLKVLGQLSNIVSNLEIHVVVYICLLRVADWEIFNGKSQRKFHAAYFTVQTLYCLQNLYCIYLVMKIALAIILLSSFPTSKKWDSLWHIVSIFSNILMVELSVTMVALSHVTTLLLAI